MESGKLNKVVRVYARDLTTDVYGSQSIAYNLIYTTKGSIKRIDGNSAVINDLVVYTYPISVWVRKYVPIVDYCIVEIDGVYYEVDSVINELDKLNIRAHSVDSSLINIRNENQP